MYLSKTPTFIQKLFPNFVWRIPDAKGKLYLSFDDGPIPEVTPWVLDTLAQYDAKASFFCVGDNVDRHPDIYARILEDGHTVGSHTQNHLSGWKSENLEYFLNARKCARRVNSSLFRPPYGKLTRSQAQFLQRHYTIVMWDVLSGDFDAEISAEKCLKNIITSATDGSIIVLHDSLKTADKLREILPTILEHFIALGYSFETLGSALYEQHTSDQKLIA